MPEIPDTDYGFYYDVLQKYSDILNLHLINRNIVELCKKFKILNQDFNVLHEDNDM